MSVRNLFESVTNTPEGFKTQCPFCNHAGKTLAWNEEKSLGCCFSIDCDFYYRKGGVSEAELKSFFGERSVYTKTLESTRKDDPELPKEFQLLQDLRPGLKDAVTEYLLSRGLLKKVLEQAMVGYCSTGKFWGYIVFPVVINGDVVYWQARRFKKRTPKFYNPASTRKSEWLYRLGRGKQPKGAVIVESVINALTLVTEKGLGWSVYVLLGKTISDTQIREVGKHRDRLREIVIALDGDARREALELAKRLHGTIPSVKVAAIPDGEDLNSLGREKAWDLIYAAQLYKPQEHFAMLEGL